MELLDAIKSRRGLFAGFGSIVAFATTNLLIYSSGESTPPLVLTVWSSASIVCLSLAAIAITGASIRDFTDGTSLCFIASTAALKGLGELSLISSVVYATPGDAIAVQNTMPVFTFIFGVTCMKERCRWNDLLVTLVAIAGVFLMVRPPFLLELFESEGAETSAGSTMHVIGIVLSLISAALSGLALVFGHYLGFSRSSLSPLFIVLSTGTVEFVVSVISSTIKQLWVAPETYLATAQLLAIGVTDFLGLILVFYAVGNERATVVAIIMSFEIVLVFLGQILILKVPAQLIEVVGALLILSACIVSAIEPNEVRDGEDEERSDGEEKELIEQQEPEKDKAGLSNRKP